jgi:hypothetical protein
VRDLHSILHRNQQRSQRYGEVKKSMVALIKDGLEDHFAEQLVYVAPNLILYYKEVDPKSRIPSERA